MTIITYERLRFITAIAPILLCSTIASSQITPPPGFTVTNLVPSGPDIATSMCIAPDGRVFIGTQDGRIRIWKEGVGLLPAPFYTLDVSIDGLEGGLVGMALHPDFATNTFVYVHYTQFNTPTDTPQKVTRISASIANPDIADLDSEVTIFEFQHEMYYRHNGGCLRFGPDGMLYVAIGDKQTQSSKSLDTLFGKILRLNPDGTIPDDNPTMFDGVAGTTIGVNRAIWAIGLRNPFRFAFHSETGRMFINDVGAESWEEVNEGKPGRNFGWPTTEGDFDASTHPSDTRPIVAYPHSPSGGVIWGEAILGGTFYNPQVCTFPPQYYDQYLFSDYRGFYELDPQSGRLSWFSRTLLNYCPDVRLTNDGAIVMVTLNGKLIRLEYTEPLPPVVVRHPAPQILCENETANLSLVVSASLPISYQWQRNGIRIVDALGISGSQTRELKIADIQPGHAGQYTCLIQNAHGNTQTTPVVVSVGPAASGYNGAYIQDLVDALIDNSHEPADLCRFDFNANGSIDPTDINPFVAAMIAD